MAVMGVRINDGGGVDTSVANVFAKALFGDPDREMRFARLESDLATDEFQRAQIRANEDYIRSQEALKQQQFQGNEAMVNPLAKLLQDYQTSTQQPGPVSEAPVPVELGPDPYAPIPADRPTVAAEAPVPVEYGIGDPDPYIPVPADRPVLAPAPTAPIELPPEANPMASTLANLLSPDEMPAPILESYYDDPSFMPPGYDPANQVSALNLMQQPEVTPDQPGVLRTGDINQLAPTPGNVPPVTTLDTFNVTPGQEVEDDGLPVPVEAAVEQPFVDPNAGRAVRPPQAEAPVAVDEFVDPNAGREPRPEEVKAVADEVQRRTGTGLSYADAQGIAKGLIANGGDIAGNFNKLLGTAGLTYGDPSNAEKLRQSMALIGHTPNTTMVAGASDTIGVDAAARQAIATENANPDLKKRISSTGGVDVQLTEDDEGNITAKPIAGATPKDAKTEVIEGIPYQVTTDAKGDAHYKLADGFTAPDAPAFNVSSLDGAILNKLVEYNKKKKRGETTTPEEDLEYSVAFKEKFTPKTTSVRLPNGQQDTQTQFFDPPSDFLVPKDFARPTDTTQPQPQTEGPAADATANPPPPQAGKPITVKATAGEFAGQEVPVKGYGGWTQPGETAPSRTTTIQTPTGPVQHTVSGDEKERLVTGEASKAYRTSKEAIHAQAKLNEYGPGGKDVPTNLQRTLADWESETVSGDLLRNVVDQDTREYLRAVLTFINMPKRNESGAAVSLKEVQDYIRRYTMSPGSKDLREYLSAKNARVQQMRSSRTSLTSELKSTDLQDWDRELARYGVDLDWVPPSEAELKAEKEKIVRRRPNPETGTLEEVRK